LKTTRAGIGIGLKMNEMNKHDMAHAQTSILACVLLFKVLFTDRAGLCTCVNLKFPKVWEVWEQSLFINLCYCCDVTL